VEFGALDERPVDAIFAMVNPTIRIHLHLFSRLAFALKSPGFLRKVKSKASEAEIIAEAAAVEAAMSPARASTAADEPQGATD
jgi:PTS system nitrogen regulatory IIA component